MQLVRHFPLEVPSTTVDSETDGVLVVIDSDEHVTQPTICVCLYWRGNDKK